MGMDAQMAGDLVAFMEPVTKWSTMVLDPSSLLRVLRRAIKIAATPPMGPVYVCLPADILDAPARRAGAPDLASRRRGWRPRRLSYARWPRCWPRPRKPMIFIGDGVAYSGAQAELDARGRAAGRRGVGGGRRRGQHALQPSAVPGHDRPHVRPAQPADHRQRATPTWSSAPTSLPEVFPELGDVFAPGAKVIHIDLNAYEIAKNHPVDLGVVADPKLTLALLAEALEAVMTPAQRQAAAARTAALAEAKQTKRQAELAKDREARDARPAEDVALHGGAGRTAAQPTPSSSTRR